MSNSSPKPVRTRFAPSPTGFLHVGGVRTALFAWLLARHHQGQFILRIEDTDRERLVPGAVQAIIEDLRWLGIDFDEGPSTEELIEGGYSWDGVKGIGGSKGPYIQSQRLDRYKKAAEELVRLGAAYRCDCTPERLAEERAIQQARKEPPGYTGHCRNRDVSADSKHVIRLKIPEGRTVSFVDAIKGRIEWHSLALRDTVLLKSDGFPTYHLAALVDDHDMEISHVIRSDEWVPSTPIHLLTYEALGWEAPIICHPPVVLGADGKKLSKRHGATFVSAFREAGYLPEALFNFMALIGWAPGEGEEQEIFSKEELIRRFSLEHVNSAGGIFSYEKLNWMNGMYIRALDVPELTRRIRPLLVEAKLTVDEEKLAKIVPHIQERMVYLNDAVGLIDFLFVDTVTPELSLLLQKGVDRGKAKEILTLALETLEALPVFDTKSVEAALRQLVEKLGLPAGGVFSTIRIAVTGKKVTPPLFESIDALGKSDTTKRLRDVLSRLQQAEAGSENGSAVV